MFWLGLVIGLPAGGCVGLLMAAMLVAGRRTPGAEDAEREADLADRARRAGM